MVTPSIATEIETIDIMVNQRLPVATPIASVNPMQIFIGIFTVVWLIGIAEKTIFIDKSLVVTREILFF